MKTYIITENQLSKILNKKSELITKGIGLKISDENGEYYKSVMESFSDEKEFNHWKDNLDKNTKIIAVMDIESTPKKVVKESADFDSRKKKVAIKTITNLLRKEYPFIIDIIPNGYNDGMFLNIDIVFDLNKFYKITNTNPPSLYIGKDYLMEMLEEPGYYLSRYIEGGDFENFGTNYNLKIRAFIEKMNSALPIGIRFLKFEDFTDEELESVRGNLDVRNVLSFYKKWKEDKEPIEFDIHQWIPKVDFSRLK
jgi:hypothetical protein